MAVARRFPAALGSIDGAVAAPGAVALTFDDGPDPIVTPRLLDLLKARDIAATFFLVTERVSRHPDLIRRTGCGWPRDSASHRPSRAPFAGSGGSAETTAQRRARSARRCRVPCYLHGHSEPFARVLAIQGRKRSCPQGHSALFQASWRHARGHSQSSGGVERRGNQLTSWLERIDALRLTASFESHSPRHP